MLYQPQEAHAAFAPDFCLQVASSSLWVLAFIAAYTSCTPELTHGFPAWSRTMRHGIPRIPKVSPKLLCAEPPNLAVSHLPCDSFM
mmetsp:Transcript_57661/g.122668  ORF Transcript_57661/g.122668 Transcript_57661/m.122668 type:complete len:86 (+) Transcript_57661:193-450(+)